MNIGVLSDTHNFLDPKIPGLFAGVHHILHAGDIGLPSLLLELRKIAPVTCVSGNTDNPAFHFKLIETVNLEGRRFLLQHIVNPYNPSDSLKARIARGHGRHRVRPFPQTLLSNPARRPVLESRLLRQTPLWPPAHPGHSPLRPGGPPPGIPPVVRARPKNSDPDLCRRLYRHPLSRNSRSDKVYDKGCDQAFIAASFSDRF